MRIQEAIEKAQEGGYTPYQLQGRSCAMPEQYFLDTSFWEALVRALGVEGDCEYIQLHRGEPRKIQQPMWLYCWHRFNNHLVAGRSPESFFEMFSPLPEAARGSEVGTATIADHSRSEGPSPREWHGAPPFMGIDET